MASRRRSDRGGNFTAFCDREYPVLVAALTLWCGDRWLAEEVTSEALARAYRDWSKVGDLDAPGAWVRRVAMNLATSTFRRRRAEARANRRAATQASEEHHDGDRAVVVAVRQALQQLSEDHRTVLVLRHYLDLPVAEVAAITGRSTSAVTSLAQRASAALAEKLAEEEPDHHAAGGAS